MNAVMLKQESKGGPEANECPRIKNMFKKLIVNIGNGYIFSVKNQLYYAFSDCF